MSLDCLQDVLSTCGTFFLFFLWLHFDIRQDFRSSSFSRTAQYKTISLPLARPGQHGAAAAPQEPGESAILHTESLIGRQKPNAPDSALGLKLSPDICRLVYIYIYCPNSYCGSASPRQSCAHRRHSGAHLFWLFAVRILTLLITLRSSNNLLIFLKLARCHQNSDTLFIWPHVCCLVNSRPGGRALGGRPGPAPRGTTVSLHVPAFQPTGLPFRKVEKASGRPKSRLLVLSAASQ